MNLTNTTQLIEIRNYVANAINNFSLPRDQVKQLNNTLMVLDHCIVDCILSEEFKGLIGYENLDEIISEAIKNNNIKSGMKPQQ